MSPLRRKVTACLVIRRGNVALVLHSYSPVPLREEAQGRGHSVPGQRHLLARLPPDADAASHGHA
jgi:hypothetical protein